MSVARTLREASTFPNTVTQPSDGSFGSSLLGEAGSVAPFDTRLFFKVRVATPTPPATADVPATTPKPIAITAPIPSTYMTAATARSGTAEATRIIARLRVTGKLPNVKVYRSAPSSWRCTGSSRHRFGFAAVFLLVGAASVDSVRLATPFGFAGVFLLVGAASVDSVRLATPFGFAGVFFCW